MSIFVEAKSAISSFVNRLFADQRRSQLSELLQLAANNMPSCEFYSYREEMQNRMDYYRGSMQGDMRDEIKRRFPQEYLTLEREQVNLPIVRKQIKDQAKVFCAAGEIYLVDERGDRLMNDDRAKRFDDLMDQVHIHSVLKDADEITQLCHRSAVKAWWDARKKQTCLSVWPPYMVNLVVKPDEWWSADACYAVLFELPGIDGYASTFPRYEVWGIRDLEAAAITQQNTVHYTTDGTNDYPVNPQDVNPFLDPRSGEPIYPFVWWQDDTGTNLYTIGDDDCLTINRRINGGLADIVHAIHYKAMGVWVHTMAESGSPLGVKTVGPSTVVDLPFGAKLENISTNLPVRETYDFFKELADAKAMLSGLPASAIRVESAAPESGYSVKLRNRPLEEHRENMIEVYRPYVPETAYRAVIVHNTYADATIDLTGLRIHWEPGDIPVPEDPAEAASNEIQKISKNVSSSVEWRMKDAGEDRKTAEASVRRCTEENKAYAGSGSVKRPEFGGPEDQPGGEGADPDVPGEPGRGAAAGDNAGSEDRRRAVAQLDNDD